jgi:hypothetical protein
LSPRNNQSTTSNFETGIAKIQGGSEQTMTQAEKHACRSFRKEANFGCSDDDSDSDREDSSLKEIRKLKIKDNGGQQLE